MEVCSSTPHLCLTDFSNRTAQVRESKSDLALLSPHRSDVIPLLGRELVIANIEQWMESESQVSIRTIVARGGEGKTRLASEIVSRAIRAGWLAGFVEIRELSRFVRQPDISKWKWDKRTLIVVDYAARVAQQINEILAVLIDKDQNSPPLRLLLLERHANPEYGWFPTIFGRGDSDASLAALRLMDPPEPVTLSSIDDVSIRRTIFKTILARKRPDLELSAIDNDSTLEKSLLDEKWAGTPLYLIIAGLNAGSMGIENSLRLNRDEIAITIARRELNRIDEIARAGGGAPGKLMPRHLAVLSTLGQGMPLNQLRDLASEERSTIDPTADLNASIDALMNGLDVYPQMAEVLPLVPDIIGEAVVLDWLGRYGTLASIGIDGRSSIERVWRRKPEEVANFLIRTVQDFFSDGHEEAEHWLRHLLEFEPLDLALMKRISSRLPSETLGLKEIGLNLARRISSEIQRAISSQDPREDESLQLFSALMSQCQRSLICNLPEESLELATEAINILQGLSDETGEAFLPSLAGALNNKAAALMLLDQASEALKACDESISIRSSLAGKYPSIFNADLSNTLHNRALILQQLKRHSEALADCSEAIKLRRQAIELGVEELLPALAYSLAVYSDCLASEARHHEALAAVQESCAILSKLCRVHPDAFSYRLAHALVKSRSRLLAVGRSEETAAVSLSIVALYRRIASVDRDVSNKKLSTLDLARSLSALSEDLYDSGNLDGAISAKSESVDLYHSLALDGEKGHPSELARCLRKLSELLWSCGRFEEAEAAISESVAIFREIAEHDSTFLPDLAGSLDNMGVCFGAAGRHKDALNAHRESVFIFKQLTVDHPTEYEFDLAGSTFNLAARLSGSGLDGEALAALREAAALYRKSSKSILKTFMLSLSLLQIGRTLLKLNDVAGSLASASESIGYWRHLNQSQSDQVLQRCMHFLQEASRIILSIGEGQKRLVLLRRLVDLYGRLEKQFSHRPLPEQAKAARALGEELISCDRTKDGLAALRDSARIYRQLNSENGGLFLKELAEVLNAEGSALFRMNRYRKALPVSKDVVEIYWRLATENPTVLPTLAACLASLDAVLVRMGQFAEAAEASREALVVFGRIATPLSLSEKNLLQFLRMNYIDSCARAGIVPEVEILK
ncbi:TPR repeat-containing protein [Rhodopseudomonas palustris TIE-1]|nr:TPR repeat-containing protein [Rhodopseudomonas palustris TIE-1]